MLEFQSNSDSDSRVAPDGGLESWKEVAFFVTAMNRRVDAIPCMILPLC
jgi:hypothetical protein